MAYEARRLSLEESRHWESTIRNHICHENELVNQRIGWLIQMQGLLFAALAFAWEKAPKGLIILFAALGIATALSLWTAIGLYSPAVRGLRNWWENHRAPDYPSGPAVIGLWMPSEGLHKVLRPWRTLPLIFVIAWIGVVLVAF